MEKVNGKRIFAKPEEVFVGQKVFDWCGEVDSKSNEFESKTGIVSGNFCITGEDNSTVVQHCLRPRHPFWLFLGIRSQYKADKNKNRAYDVARPFTGIHPGYMAWNLGQIGEKGAKEELHPKCSYLKSVLRQIYGRRRPTIIGNIIKDEHS